MGTTGDPVDDRRGHQYANAGPHPRRQPRRSQRRADPQWRGLYAYTAINAPRGLDERIYHVWQFNGKEVDRIPLDIHGGRKEGYRAWTHKQNFPGNPAGKWQVRVLTEDGQLIGVLRFKVTGQHTDQRKVVRFVLLRRSA